MVVAGIGLLFGLIMLFLGMAIIEQDRKDKKKIKAAREQKIADSVEQTDMVSALVDNENPLTYADIRRVKLGAFLVAQGVLMAVVGIAMFIINAYWVNIPWYIALPVVLVLFIISIVADAYMMGTPRGEGEDDTAPDDSAVASDADALQNVGEKAETKCEQDDADSEV